MPAPPPPALPKVAPDIPLPPIIPTRQVPPAPVTAAAKLTAKQGTAERSGATRRTATQMQGERTPLPPGARVGSYTITAKIGIGGFGIVYSATHTEEGTPVAIKEHMPEGLAVRRANDTYVHPSSPETEARFKATVGEFLEEVTVLMGISHPGIVPILTAFEANGTAYYVMPFQTGTPMDVADQGSLDTAQQAQTARHNKRLLLSLLSTLDYLRLHRIVHRDIKPDNIIITEEGNTVLLDFGSARQLQPGKVFTNVFTPDFSAPEQSHAETDAEMTESLGPWTDIYALGVCFYYLITHLYPPRSELRVISAQDPYTPLAGRADLEHLYGAPFLRAIDRALELKITDRWQSAAAWRIAIGEGMMPTPAKKKRKLRPATVAGIAALSVFAALSVWAFHERSQALKALDTSLTFNNILLNDIRRESADIPGAANMQRILGQRLDAYLNNMRHTPGIDRVKYLITLSSAWRNYGELYAAQGQLREADKAYHHAAELLTELRELDAENIIHSYDMALVLLGRVEIARRRHQTRQMHQALEEATDILRKLCKQAPHNPDFSTALGQALAEKAHTLRKEGDAGAYRAALDRSLTLHRSLQSDYPEHLKAREGLGYALLYSGKELLDSDKPEEAREQLEESRRIFADLTARRPYQLSFKKGLARAYDALGALYSQLSEATPEPTPRAQYREQALSAFRKHNELISFLETQDVDKEENAYMLSRTLARMVHILLETEQPNLAESCCKTILLQTDKLLEDSPDNLNYAQLAADAKRGIALAHSRSSYDAEDVTEDFREYRSAMEELLKRDPTTPALQYRYAEALIESAVFSHKIGSPADQAREWLTQAQDILRKLPQDTPAHTDALQKASALLEQLPQATPPHSFTDEEE